MVAINEQKWRWAGHVARKEDNRWRKRLTDWTPRESKRDRRRSDRRWQDEIEKTAGATWQQLAKSRESWKRLREGLFPAVDYERLMMMMMIYI